MPPPPIPVRTEGSSNPPPIPAPAKTTDLSIDEGHGASSSSPAQDANLQKAPDRNAKRRPAGAVATAMVSGHQALPSAGLRRLQEEAAIETADEHSHANNPYDLQAALGSTVSASYPFQGDEALQQLSFVVGDVIKIKEKEEMWSWGVLERNGKEGWFPHNYVGSTFKPLPGIHELAAKLQKRREQQEGYEAARGTGTDVGGMTDNPSKDGPPVSGEGSYQSGTAGQPDKTDDAGTASGTASGPSKSDGSIVSGADDAVNNRNAGAGAALAKELEGKGVIQETGGQFSTMASGDSAPKPKPGLMSSSAAPSLPPFFKSSAPSSGMACRDEVTQRPADETTTARTVDDNKIEGVGFAGEATAVKAGCKCSIM